MRSAAAQRHNSEPNYLPSSNGGHQLGGPRDVYKSVKESRSCGHIELAGRSVGVPFVGAIASTLAIAELIRRIMGADQFDRVRLQLATPHEPATRAGHRRRLRAPSQPVVEQLAAQ
jgi:hypothetical protein